MEQRLYELFKEAVGKDLGDGVLSVHSTEILKFAKLVVEEYSTTAQQCGELKSVLRQIRDVESESDEWDAVERVLPEIYALVDDVLKKLN